jgi:hypothetical protein
MERSSGQTVANLGTRGGDGSSSQLDGGPRSGESQLCHKGKYYTTDSGICIAVMAFAGAVNGLVKRRSGTVWTEAPTRVCSPAWDALQLEIRLSENVRDIEA